MLERLPGDLFEERLPVRGRRVHKVVDPVDLVLADREGCIGNVGHESRSGSGRQVKGVPLLKDLQESLTDQP